MTKRDTEKRLEAVEYWQFVRRIAGFVGEDYRAAAWKAARAMPRGDGSKPLVALLDSISDEQKDPPKSLLPGTTFFTDLKRRTIFGYYTSLEGRVQELGLPEAVSLQTWRGCPHPDGRHGT